MKKIEAAGTADEVLREELREYKDTLTCPSCKVRLVSHRITNSLLSHKALVADWLLFGTMGCSFCQKNKQNKQR